MKRVLFISDADSVWLKDYIEEVLIGKNVEIVIVSYQNERFRHFYANYGIKVRTFREEKKLSFHEVSERVKFYSELIKDIGDIDIIHVQYFDKGLLIKSLCFWWKCKKRIITFWGSDVLRRTKEELLPFYIFVRTSQELVVMTEEMREMGIKIFGSYFKKHVQVMDFGNPLYETLNQVGKEWSRKDCKRYWGIKEEKIVIPIGYNKNLEHQHLKIINALIHLPRKVLDQLVIVLHFGYGQCPDEYIEEIKNTLEDNALEYLYIDKFLDKKETALLRMSADVFIYGQTTDALSGSVLEYVYAGAVLIKPKWLDYTALDKRGIIYEEYAEFEEINTILQKVLLELDMYDVNYAIENRNKLWEMNSWEVLAPKWKSLYDLEEIE